MARKEKNLKVDFSKLDRAFKPQTVAVVGASRKNNFHWLRNLSEFQGKVYSVQVNPESIPGIQALGIENVTSLLDIPVRVDLVIVTTPRTLALRILDDCILKEVGAVHFFTSGFGETGQKEGMDLERLLVEKAERANCHIVGINCRGLFTPQIGLKQIAEQYSGISGPVGFISQSGGHAMTFSRQAFLQGIIINKSISFGNGIVIDGSDFLEYFGQDPEIKVIGLYLEGVRDGRRFFEVLKKVSARKPVVILKGGRTDDGGRAIASHTGSLAIAVDIWNAAVKQSGAVSVPGLEEMIDTLKALLFLPPVRGERIGVAGGAGGESIAITDILVETGLKVPELTRNSYDELETFFSLVGGSCRNPIDTDIGPNRRHLERVLEILADDPHIDHLLLMTRVGRFLYSRELQEKDIEIAGRIRQKSAKPLIAVLPFVTAEEMQEAIDIIPRYQTKGIPVFPTMSRAALALKNTLDYHRFKRLRAGA
jgi:acetyl-CoA synthetase (ADP-forming)